MAACLLAAAPAVAAEAPQDFAWRQRQGAQLPLGAMLHDQTGRLVSLGSLLGKAPAVLDFGYFRCPSLCGVVRSDLWRAAQAGGLVPGRDFTLLAVSIDPAETPGDAAAAHAADGTQGSAADGTQGGAADAGGVHYLTGDAGKLEAAAGFRARYDARFKQFLHPAGLVVLTREGVVSAYLLGVGYSGGDLRAAVLRAGEGGVARASLPILLLCFHYDPATGRYTLAIEKLLRLAAALTVLTLGGTLLALHRAGRPRA